ncbi:hypothetical protein EVAR_27418_1 [Eumeta japonica]|uniref:Uncharacterized protein n=1 Tax=Eumeta variegata TaxID=151549 RepID=A0A4C1VKJ3_EUMVA|nr:hypothetical protein EVAR_27418_1 [Eumeta japonica]
MRGREPRRSMRYYRGSVYQAHVSLIRVPSTCRPPPPAGCACAMTARARVWVGDWAPARCQSMDPPDTDHCHLSRRGRVPDEKTPGHEATPPSRTYTHRQGCGSPTSERAHT